MTKLTKSVNKPEDNQTDQNSLVSLSLSKKIQKEDGSESTKLEVNETQIQKAGTRIIQVNGVEDIATWLLGFMGDDLFTQLKSNPYLQLPYADNDIGINDWLVRAVKTIFTQENILQIAAQIQQNQQKIVDLETASGGVTEKISKYEQRFRELQELADETESETHTLRKELKTAIPLSRFINEVFREEGIETPEMKRLMELMAEALQSNDENVQIFMLRFAKGWMLIQSIFEQLTTDEQTNLELMHKTLTQVLFFISNVYIPERRPILEVVAKICSRKFTNYDFISPEQTLQVDPDIHNAQGLGSNRIKEGVTFAVVRRESRKAVKYAEIKVS